MYESSGSQFFRAITRIQLEPDTSQESRAAIALLTILVEGLQTSKARLVLER